MSKDTKAPVSEAAIEAEERAEVVRVESVNLDVATKLAATFDETADVFKRATILSRGVKRGATLQEVANLTTRKRVEAMFPGATPDEIDEIVGDVKRVKKLKLNVSKSSVQAYVSAWNAVVDAATLPSRETVAVMFRAKSTGGTADLIKSAVAATQEAPKEARDETLVSELRAGLATLSAVAKTTGRPNEGDEGEGSEDGATGFSLEGALHQFALIAGQNWTADEAATLAAAAVTFAESIGSTVDA